MIANIRNNIANNHDVIEIFYVNIMNNCDNIVKFHINIVNIHDNGVIWLVKKGIPTDSL